MSCNNFIRCLLAAMLCLGILAEAQVKMKPDPKVTRSTPLPTIVVKLGDDIEAAKKKSSFDFSRTYMMREGAIIEAPYTLIYDHPERGFVIENAKYLGFSRREGKELKTLSLAPHQGTLTVTETWQLFLQLVGKVEKAGWSRDTRYSERDQWINRSFDEFQKIFSAKRREIGSRGAIGLWREGPHVMRVSVVKVYEAGDSYSKAMGADEARFNVILDIEDLSGLRIPGFP